MTAPAVAALHGIAEDTVPLPAVPVTYTVRPGGIAPGDYATALLDSLDAHLAPLVDELDRCAAAQTHRAEAQRVTRTAAHARDARDYLAEQLAQVALVLAEHRRTV